MMRPPTAFDLLFNLAFFVVLNGVFMGAAWLKSRHSVGFFRGAYYVAVAPLVIMVCWLSWQWLFDATAANLWPLGLMLLGAPCAAAFLVLMAVEARVTSRRRK